MPKRKVEQIYENQWTQWSRNDRWLCCDCSLTHDVEFKVKDNRIWLRMRVNRRSTAAYRRGAGIKVICKKDDINSNTRVSRRK